MHDSTFSFMHKTWSFFDQNFSFTHETHWMACMPSLLVLASNLHIIWWNLVSMLLTYKNPCLSFQIVSNTQNFQIILLWLFTYPWSLTNNEGCRFHKISSTHVQIRIQKMLWNIWAKKISWEKTHFYIFSSTQLRHLNPNFIVNLNLRIAINLVFAQPISNPRIDPKMSRLWESMVKAPFLGFSFLPFENKGDSSTSMMDRPKTMTPEKFSKHLFSFFRHFDPFFIEFWLIWNFRMLDLANSTLRPQHLFWG